MSGLQNGALDASDSPVVAIWGMYGIFGTLIYSIFYIRLIKFIKNCYIYFRKNNIRQIFKVNKIDMILFIVFSCLFICKFIFILGLYSELISRFGRLLLMQELS